MLSRLQHAQLCCSTIQTAEAPEPPQPVPLVSSSCCVAQLECSPPCPRAHRRLRCTRRCARSTASPGHQRPRSAAAEARPGIRQGINRACHDLHLGLYIPRAWMWAGSKVVLHMQSSHWRRLVACLTAKYTPECRPTGSSSAGRRRCAPRRCAGMRRPPGTTAAPSCHRSPSQAPACS
jgi:hypothetical protein